MRAPTEQPNHAVLACRAALDMLKKVPELVAKWQPILNEQFDLGIGLNTGPAQVGNTGTKQKFKYGPLGNTVNLASRIQGATKHFKTRLLITDMTKSAIDEHASEDDIFLTRRLGKIRVINIPDDVNIHELVPEDYPNWQEVKSDCEEALDKYLAGDFRGAAGKLAHIQMAYPTDGPSLILLAKAAGCMYDPTQFSDVWILDSK